MRKACATMSSTADAKKRKEASGLLLPMRGNQSGEIAKEVLPQNKIVQFMATTICMCSTMQRIDPQHLAWTLENLVEGKVVNPIRVPAREAELRQRVMAHPRNLIPARAAALDDQARIELFVVMAEEVQATVARVNSPAAVPIRC